MICSKEFLKINGRPIVNSNTHNVPRKMTVGGWRTKKLQGDEMKEERWLGTYNKEMLSLYQQYLKYVKFLYSVVSSV